MGGLGGSDSDAHNEDLIPEGYCVIRTLFIVILNV